MNCARFGRKFFVSIVGVSLLLASAWKVLGDDARSGRRSCSSEGLVESFYVETATFFVNICRDGGDGLIYIGGEKDDPENAIKLPATAEEGVGYVADSENVMRTITGGSVEIVENGERVLKEEVISSPFEYLHNHSRTGNRQEAIGKSFKRTHEDGKETQES